MPNNNENTVASQMDISIDELLGTPGADNVMVSTEDENKPTMFTRKPKQVDINKMIDDEEDSDAEGEGKNGDPKKSTNPAEDAEKAKETIDELINEDADDKNKDSEGESTKKTGRPAGLVELGTKLIEKGYLTPFEGEEDVSKYTIKDWEELFDSNEKEKDKKRYEALSEQFYESLPEEFQVAAQYFHNGGTDMKAILRSLAAVEEIRQLDTKDENSQEQIVRSYLYAKNPDWTAEEIEADIDSYKDRDELETKAKQFKPKLDAMQEQVVARQLQQQEVKRKQQEAQAAVYTETIYKTLEPGELNGVKLDKKVQNMLFAGLTQANYPSVSGRPTNLLGHLLEKYQYVEPNPALISEALWLLADPEGYKNKLKSVGGKDQVEKTVRTLKTEQSNKTASGQGFEEHDDASRKKPGSGIARPTGGFFKR